MPQPVRVLWYRDSPLRNAVGIGRDATTHVQIHNKYYYGILPWTFYDGHVTVKYVVAISSSINSAHLYNLYRIMENSLQLLAKVVKQEYIECVCSLNVEYLPLKVGQSSSILCRIFRRNTVVKKG